MKPIFIIIALLSPTLDAITIVEGDNAQSLFQAMPVKSVEHIVPIHFNIKILQRNFTCAERRLKNQTGEDTFSYKCHLPNRNNSGKIQLDHKLSKKIFNGITGKGIKKDTVETKQAWPIICEKENDSYRCVVDI